jgi:2-dehydro-3-deoxyphosphooctonate aldolase (KDO 8-P synthase)
MSTAQSSFDVSGVTFSNAAPLALIAGPCQMESRDHAFQIAGALKEITTKLGIGLVYKSSFDKAVLRRRCRFSPTSSPSSHCR